MEFLKRDCPLCRRETTSPLVVVSQPSAEQLEFAQTKPYWSGFFKQKAFFSYARCAECGLLYCPVFYTAEQLIDLYSHMADNTAGVPVSSLRKTHGGYFKTLQRHCALQGQYMELGPDIGLFTEYCVTRGHFDEYWLFEPNKNIWDQLKQRMSGTQHHTLAEMANYEAIADDSLSVAVMIHVLDHLLDPGEILQKIRKKLKKEAILLIVTHDESSLLAKLIKHRWPPYCLQHPQLYSPKTITHLLKGYGYGVKEIKKTANYFPVTYLLTHLLWLMRIKGDWLPKLDELQVGLKLGNILTVATPQ